MFFLERESPLVSFPISQGGRLLARLYISAQEVCLHELIRLTHNLIPLKCYTFLAIMTYAYYVLVPFLVCALYRMSSKCDESESE